MADYFLDTSALVKRHVNEVGSSWVRSLVRAASGHRIYIASVTAVEVVSAITRRQRPGGLSVAQGGAMIGHFRRHLGQRYRIIELTPSLIEEAMQKTRRHRLRAYDAVQLAAALDIDNLQQTMGLAAVTLVSADQELNAAALAEGLSVEDPNAHP